MAKAGGADHAALATAKRILKNRHLLSEDEAKNAARALPIVIKELERRIAETEAQTETERIHSERAARQKKAARLKQSFKAFFVEAWEHLESIELVMGKHITLMCDYSEALSRGELPNSDPFLNLVVNIPPEQSKSVVCSIMWPAWLLANDPTTEIITISYSDKLQKKQMKAFRKLITSAWYQSLFPEIRIGDTDNESHISFVGGGYRMSTTCPGGQLKGFHPNILIIDDPQNPDEAESKSARDKVIRWWKETAADRGIGKRRRLLCVAQRLHKMDLPGYLLANEDGVIHLMLPVEFEPARANKDVGLGTDWRKEPGELLNPARFPQFIVDGIRRRIGSYAFAGQQQQRPTARGGGMFKRDRFDLIEKRDVPFDKFTAVCRAWDFASSDGKGDWTVGILMAIVMDPKSTRVTVYVLNMIRGQWATEEKEQKLDTFSRVDKAAYGDKYFMVIPEDPSAGKDVVSFTRRRLRDVAIRVAKVTKNKVIRAEPAATAVNAGEVKVVMGAYVTEFLDELESFPNGEHDDIPDAFGDGYKALGAGDHWFLGGLNKDDAESVYGRDCEYEKCNRKAAPDSAFCCECCEAAAESGDELDDESHSPACVYRHSNLFAKGVWKYSRKTS